ncbi:MAG TPA: hypothetical protein VJ694_03110 [Patescibacteria group bacterium]|nr:hypothetical protein [Patescibacteria group bacterium]
MRFTLATAVFLAGCLHAQGPATGKAKADPATLHAFDLLVNDAETIDDAAEFAKAKGLTRDEIVGAADRAYWSFMRAEIYPPAAEIASRFGFGARGISLPLAEQRKDADKATAAYLARQREDDGRKKLYAAIWELQLEMRISCRYGPTPKEARETIQRAMTLEAVSGEDDVLYPLLDEGCRVDAALRIQIIDRALLEGKKDYAILHGAASGWDEPRLSQFLWGFFLQGDCTYGVKALVAFKLPVAEAARIVVGARCEDENIDTRGWSLSKEAAGSWFFAAARGKQYNLALALLPFTDFGGNGEVFLFESVAREGLEPVFIKTIKRRLDRHEAFMAFMWERGRYRFVANFALTLDWQRKGFDKLIELGKWEDAAEAAQYGVGEAFRTEGVLIAFRAAMAAGDFKAGRYFVARYGPLKDKPGLVTQEMYDEEKDKFYAAKQAAGDPEWMKEPKAAPRTKAKRPKKRRRSKPPCPDGDWCP